MARILPIVHAGTCLVTLLSLVVLVAGLSKLTALIDGLVQPVARRSVYGLAWWLVVYEFLALLVTTSLLVACNHARKMLATALLAINATLFITSVNLDLNTLDLFKIYGIKDISWYLPCLVAGFILLAIANNVHLLLLGFSGECSLALTRPSQQVPPQQLRKAVPGTYAAAEVEECPKQAQINQKKGFQCA